MIVKKFVSYVDSLLSKFFGKKKYARTFFVKTLKEGDSLCLRTPDNVPEEIINHFTSVFSKHRSILMAYVATGFLSADEKEPHYIIGMKIDPTADLKGRQLMEVMASDITKIIPKGFYVDILEIGDQKNPTNDFMRDYLIPFYSRDFK